MGAGKGRILRIKPFMGLRPRAENAQAVAAVPYDTIDTAEARELGAGNPRSFLRVIRPEIDLADGVDPYSPEVYRKGAANLGLFEREGYLTRETSPSLYVYRQQMAGHVQRGVVTCCHVEDYESNIILRHETTRPDKEDDRATLLNIVNANTGPIFMAYRDRPGIDEIVRGVEEGEPLFDITAPDGVHHTVWRLGDPEVMVRAFEPVPRSYIADGHHRAAAAVSVAHRRRDANATHSGDEEYNWFLAVLFPAGQLRILPYNRCVRDLNGLSGESFLEAVRRSFSVTGAASPMPGSTGCIGMYLDGTWYELRPVGPVSSDPVFSLDVARLQADLLGPVLGVLDPRTDDRIEFIGGVRGTAELTACVDSGRAAVAFSMYPVTPDKMMRIADAGMTMPPKSTWFEPKLRSGLFVHTL